jgi:hypothetical protein
MSLKVTHCLAQIHSTLIKYWILRELAAAKWDPLSGSILGREFGLDVIKRATIAGLIRKILSEQRVDSLTARLARRRGELDFLKEISKAVNTNPAIPAYNKDRLVNGLRRWSAPTLAAATQINKRENRIYVSIRILAVDIQAKIDRDSKELAFIKSARGTQLMNLSGWLTPDRVLAAALLDQCPA